MKMTIEPTGRFQKWEGVNCRIWEGMTDGGTKVEVFVPCVQARSNEDQRDLESALREVKAERQLVSFDHRLL